MVVLAGLALLAYGLTGDDDGLAPAAAAGGSVESEAVGDEDEGLASFWIDGVSEPGVTVFVDGDSVGTMPLWLDRVAGGARRVRVVAPDGATLADTVLMAIGGVTTDLIFDPLQMRPVPATDPNLEGDPTGPATAEATPAPGLDATGDLRVTSSPSGATVALNGRRVGATPLSLGGLRPGRHAVSVARQGFEATTRQVDVPADRALEVAVALRPLSPAAGPSPPAGPPAAPAPAPAPAATAPVGTGTLEVLVQPWGRIVIDGTTHRRETDVVYRTTLPAGAHTVTVSHPQLGSEERTVVVQAGVQSRVEFDLRGNAPADGSRAPGDER